MIKIRFGLQKHLNHWKISVMFAIIFLAVADCDLLSTPENNWIKIGHQNPVVFKCKSAAPRRLNWLMKTSSSSQEFLIFDGYRVNKDVISYCKVVNGEPGKYDLNLNATTKAGQQYVCQDPFTLMRASAELIVIESDPECNVTTDGEFTTLTCHMLSHSNWAPAMECQNGNSGEVIGEIAYNRSSSGEGLTSRLIVPTNHSQDPNIFYTCRTKFRLQEKPSDTTATNIPLYIYAWNSTKHTAEQHKGYGDSARETSEATAGKEPDTKPAVIAASVVGLVAVIGLVFAAIFIGRFYNKNKNENLQRKKEQDSLIVTVENWPT